MIEPRESLLLKCLPPDASGFLDRGRCRLRLRHVRGGFGWRGLQLGLRLWFLRRLRIGGLGRSHDLGALRLFLLALRRKRRGKGHVTGFQCSVADRRGVGAGQGLQHEAARIAGNASDLAGASAEPKTPQCDSGITGGHAAFLWIASPQKRE